VPDSLCGDLLAGLVSGPFSLRFALIAVGGLFVMTAIVILLFWSGCGFPEAPAALTWFRPLRPSSPQHWSNGTNGRC
jgi:hypothetical protein